MSSHVDAAPVVEACSLELSVADREAERFDQVQRAAGRRAQSRDVSRVGRDLGLDEHDSQRRVGGGRCGDAVGGLNDGAGHPRLIRA